MGNRISKIKTKNANGANDYDIGSTFSNVLFDEDENSEYSLKDFYNEVQTYLNRNMHTLYGKASDFLDVNEARDSNGEGSANVYSAAVEWFDTVR